MRLPGTASPSPRGSVPSMRSASTPFVAFALAVLAAGPLAAQQARVAPADLRAEATAGSEAERYLRVLQVAGRAPLYPWSLRAFSPREVDALAADSAGP